MNATNPDAIVEFNNIQVGFWLSKRDLILKCSHWELLLDMEKAGIVTKDSPHNQSIEPQDYRLNPVRWKSETDNLIREVINAAHDCGRYKGDSLSLYNKMLHRQEEAVKSLKAHLASH